VDQVNLDKNIVGLAIMAHPLDIDASRRTDEVGDRDSNRLFRWLSLQMALALTRHHVA